MATVDPSLRVIISGTEVTSLDTTASWTLENKIEKTYTIIDTDGQKTIDLTNVESTNLLVFTATGDFKVEFSIDGGANVIDFTIDSSHPFILPTNQTFIDTLDSIKISTAETTDIEVSVRVYGEDAG